MPMPPVLRGSLRWLRSRGLLAACMLAGLLPSTAPAQAPLGTPAFTAPTADPAAQPRPRPLGRPRIGLVLSGGGARGLTHVGVLKVLERERVPIDAIAGTSMGAIIGGLYASGMSAAFIEDELLKVDWEATFATRPPREALSQRRKEEDYEVSPAIEVGIQHDTRSLMLPLGTVSSRGLELLLRRYTLPARHIRRFDDLPIPFRAVATDMETGQPVVFSQGDLAAALRASMSVPGVFPPTDVDGRILGDGGLVSNLPVEVARSMGVDIVIAVNIGTPLSPREALATVTGLTQQMVNILTEQNVQRSLAALDAQRDVLISPQLGRLTVSDFARVRELIEIGERQADRQVAQLAGLALPPDQWQAWQTARATPPLTPLTITSVRIEGARNTHPEVYTDLLQARPGQPFFRSMAEADSRLLAASGDYLHADYRLVDEPSPGVNGGTGIVYMVEEKPWGPNYFRVGLGLSSDFSGRGDYSVKISHNRHWLTNDGAEWRNLVEIGSSPRWSTEWYQPIGEKRSPRSDWFVSLRLGGERRRLDAYAPLAPGDSARDAPLISRYARNTTRLGLDIGQPWGPLGELRLGVFSEVQDISPDFFAGASASALRPQQARERAARAAVVMDQLDAVSFPRAGWRVRSEALAGRRTASGELLVGGTSYFHRFEFDGTYVASRGPQTLDSTVRLRWAVQQLIQGLGYYTLGGFHNLSGYEFNQLSGNRTFLLRETYYVRLNSQPVLTRGFFAGASLELGNAWSRDSRMGLGDLRPAGSLFLGADTGLGPLYVGVTYAARGTGPGLYLLLGRP